MTGLDTPPSTPASSPADPAKAILTTLRGVLHLIAIAIVTAWGFIGWPLPFPGILTGIGFLALAVLLWALFLSPRPVLRTDRFGEALVELLLFTGAAAALLVMGVHWGWALGFGVVAVAVGYVAASRKR